LTRKNPNPYQIWANRREIHPPEPPKGPLLSRSRSAGRPLIAQKPGGRCGRWEVSGRIRAEKLVGLVRGFWGAEER
jgi:hypothetical protein